MKMRKSPKVIMHTFIEYVKSAQTKKRLERALTLLLALIFMLSTVAMAVPVLDEYVLGLVDGFHPSANREPSHMLQMS